MAEDKARSKDAARATEIVVWQNIFYKEKIKIVFDRFLLILASNFNVQKTFSLLKSNQSKLKIFEFEAVSNTLIKILYDRNYLIG